MKTKIVGLLMNHVMNMLEREKTMFVQMLVLVGSMSVMLTALEPLFSMQYHNRLTAFLIIQTSIATMQQQILGLCNRAIWYSSNMVVIGIKPTTGLIITLESPSKLESIERSPTLVFSTLVHREVDMIDTWVSEATDHISEPGKALDFMEHSEVLTYSTAISINGTL